MGIEVVLLARLTVRGGAGVRGVAGSSCPGKNAAETDVVPHDRPDTEIAAYPEFTEIEILSDLRIVEFVFFLVRNRASNGPDMGNSFTFRQFIRGLRRGRHE